MQFLYSDWSAMTQLFPAAVLIGGFLALVSWFDVVDVYHLHFFDAGLIMAADNVARIIFVGIFWWLIYVPGAAIAAFVMSPSERVALTPAERGVLGFGIGVGIWHVVMLILGALNWYYRPVIDGLCLIVLVASARHFTDVTLAGRRLLARHFAQPLRARVTPQAIGSILIAVVGALVLLQRGLYPAGGGDYYTHYFYYYLAVLKNHGLMPNNVWYHYYYSKGSGLAFLGMLLSDPEAPALTTFPCVMCAAIAIATLMRRVAPNSLWPAAGALTYLLFYLVGLDFGSAEGEFQKDHEEVTALVVLFTWALCMESCGPPLPCRIMAAASAIAAAILTQAVGIFLGLFAGVLCAWSLVHRQWRDMLGYAYVGVAIATAVLGMFVLSYRMTGLASDQPLDLMLRFADPTRLDRWGVIPQIIMVAWIRDNYEALVQPLGWGVFKELALTMRLEVLWPFLAAPAIAVLLRRATDTWTAGRLTLSPDPAAVSLAAAITIRLAVLLALLALIALSMGRAQSVSFGRLSTFLVPLWALFGIAGSVWALSWPSGRRLDPLGWLVLPVVLLVVVVHGWQKAENWVGRLPRETQLSLQFFIGQFSLADAYKFGFFGGINPGALAAAQQLPYDTPIWSTNASYCMAPGCLIESVVSFKMSGRLDEILGGAPELARQKLQEAGLNYFLFMKDYRLLDVLPYSRLFAPETIGRYLGVKWTDGATFLLTWIGPHTSPIGSDFLQAYRRSLNEPESPLWFAFNELAPRIAAITPVMRKAQWGTLEQYFVWRHPPPGTIDVVQGNYGRSCRDFSPKSPAKNSYHDGNATAAMIRACTGKARCQFTVEAAILGDPAPGCDKDFSAAYRCHSQDSATKTISVAGEANGVIVMLDCLSAGKPSAELWQNVSPRAWTRAAFLPEE